MRREELDPETKIGIIGGGASAVCLLDALAEAGGPAGSITIFEPGPHLWRGRAYQPDLDTVRVNIPPDGMSVRFGDRGHFQRWLDEGGARSTDRDVDALCDMRFVPRAVFGDYLVESARAALARLQQRGWQAEVVRERVDSAARTRNGVFLRTASGQRTGVGAAVLCVGRGAPPDVYGLAGTPGYVADPYPLARTLAEVGPDLDVGVLGSGLTGVDVTMALDARGHRGRVRLLSRSGVLPMVRQRRIPYTLRHFTPETFRPATVLGQTVTLDRLVAVMRDEFASAGERFDPVAAEIAAMAHEDPAQRLRRHLTDVGSSSMGLRILQCAVPATGPDIWPPLAEGDKVRLLREHYRTVMSLCCPMPPASATTLVGMIDSDRLDITPGLRHVHPAPGGGFTVVTDDGEWHADVVVNALNGPMGRVPSMADGVVATLVAAGAAEHHPRGGVRVDRRTSRLVTDGVADPRLYALGDLAAGSLFFTFGLPSIVDRAHDIVDAIRRRTVSRHPRSHERGLAAV